MRQGLDSFITCGHVGEIKQVDIVDGAIIYDIQFICVPLEAEEFCTLKQAIIDGTQFHLAIGPVTGGKL